MDDEQKDLMDTELPPPLLPMGSYVMAQRAGELVYVSGQLPRWGVEMMYTGKVDSELGLDEAKKAAQLAALNALAVLDRELEDLDKVDRIVKMTGSVASSPGFVNQPAVIDAASDILVTVLENKGKHARMVVGVAELPERAPVAVELIARVRD